MTTLLQQLKQRRLDLGLKQNDMLLRVGILRQQYQRLELKGNPRLETLELIAEGLNSHIMLIPKEKHSAVLAVLEGRTIETREAEPEDIGFYTISADCPKPSKSINKKSLSDDPWRAIWGEDFIGDDA